MNPLRSVGARLSLAFVLVVAGAVTLVYLVVVPSLERRLVDARIREVTRSAPGLARQLQRNPFEPSFAETASRTVNARVVLFQVLSQLPEASLAVTDDSGSDSELVERDEVALRVARSGRPASGTVFRGTRRFAEAAAPVGRDGQRIVLVSSSLQDTVDTVALVKRSLVSAGGIVLLISLVVGYVGSWLFARRIRKLERVADRIASGRFDQAVHDLGTDEVGELARALERMRVRIARLDGARKEFIASASHELRTPLFALGGFLEMLDDEELDDPTRREFVASAREQVERLTKLATELLDLSRLDAGQLELRPEPVDLAQVARETADEFSALARTTEHPIEVAGAPGPVALADAQRVAQVARILVDNALRHTPAGTAVRIGVRGDARSAELFVADDGPGIGDEHLGQLFDRFYRVEGGRASGSGLGLALAREFAEAMTGSVQVTSRPGATEFVLRLPAALGPDDQAGGRWRHRTHAGSRVST